MLDGAVTSGPADHWWTVLFLTRRHAILFRIDRSWNHCDAIVHLLRILGEIRISHHHVRRDATDSFCFPGKLQVAQIAVRRTAIRNKYGIVKIEDYRHAALCDQSLEQRWAEQSSLAQDVDEIVILRFTDQRKPAAEAACDELELLTHHAALVKKRVQLFVFESSKSDLYTTFAKQGFPLFEAITL